MISQEKNFIVSDSYKLFNLYDDALQNRNNFTICWYITMHVISNSECSTYAKCVGHNNERSYSRRACICQCTGFSKYVPANGSVKV